MKEISENKLFYAVIIDHDNLDHSSLRKILNSSIKNVAIESIYDEEETILFLEKLKSRPDIIFLDMNMHILFLKFVLYMVRGNEELKQVPIAIVNSNQNLKERAELKKFGVREFYNKVRRTLDRQLICNDLKSRWLFV